MTKIRILPGNHISESVFRALQYISAYHTKDFVDAMYDAWKKEESPPAKNALFQILKNSKMAAFGNRPLCQDTGIVVVFVKMGSHLIIESDKTLQELIDDGVRKAYTFPENPLRASVVANPESLRNNTKDNTPAIVHTEMVTGNEIHFWVAAKGGGSENKAKFAILNPSDSIVDFVLESIPKMGAGWCPPGVLGIGIGGTAEKAVLMAKRSLMDPIDIQDLKQKGPKNNVEKLRLELYEKVNRLGIGAQGLGGLTTVLDVKIETFPTHAASLPIAIIPNCAATRHIHFTLNDEKIPEFIPPSLDVWPDPEMKEDISLGKVINLDTITQEEIRSWKSGDRLLLRGKILTGRDAAHKRMTEIWKEGKEIPFDLKGKFIYYVGPVDPKPGTDEVVGPAGPTTSTRMDKFTEQVLERTGLFGMIGKAERGKETIDLIQKFGSVYLIAVGGAAYLVSQAIRKSKIVAFEDLGMEAVHEFEVYDMPVLVAVDANGKSIHETGPKIWKEKIKEKEAKK
ncbi:fumarate hydratase [Leptospira idonii]|uniref:Fumarate hydratase class I n=1 Tax=Leptospira idonii TaxID=1193500 RepID=A0A4R9M0C8_9LEPT|nr:fumarate hydratase [Leptospira idonii]TGN20164.1 fumarate hydratase [Leptospira idonii]